MTKEMDYMTIASFVHSGSCHLSSRAGGAVIRAGEPAAKISSQDLEAPLQPLRELPGGRAFFKLLEHEDLTLGDRWRARIVVEEAYILNASGDLRVLPGGKGGSTIFETYQLPAIMRNPEITSLNGHPISLMRYAFENDHTPRKVIAGPAIQAVLAGDKEPEILTEISKKHALPAAQLTRLLETAIERAGGGALFEALAQSHRANAKRLDALIHYKSFEAWEESLGFRRNFPHNKIKATVGRWKANRELDAARIAVAANRSRVDKVTRRLLTKDGIAEIQSNCKERVLDAGSTLRPSQERELLEPIALANRIERYIDKKLEEKLDPQKTEIDLKEEPKIARRKR